MKILEIKDLSVDFGGKKVLSNLNLTINSGEFHTIMGPNGAGKSTLAKTIMGHPDCKILSGDILFKGESIIKLPTNERALLGVSLLFQQPVELEGVSMQSLLFQMVKKKNSKISIFQFNDEAKKMLSQVGFDESVLKKQVNKDFSGGEKKKSEVLQLLLQNPRLVILDELDSGLDVDTMKRLSNNVNRLKSEGVCGIVITHYNRLLESLETDFVHVLKDGRIVLSGGVEIAKRVEKDGYAGVSA